VKSVPSSVAKGARGFARSRRLPLRWRPCQPIGVDMRLIIEARLEGAQTSASATEPTIVPWWSGKIERCRLGTHAD
jgi:hypothetical protein